MGEVSLLGWVIALLRRFFVNSASHKAVYWDPCYLPFIPHPSPMSSLSSRLLTMLSIYADDTQLYYTVLNTDDAVRAITASSRYTIGWTQMDSV